MLRLFAFFLVLQITLTPTLHAKEVIEGPVQAEVLRVIDGDTIDVRARIWLGQYVETRIRLDGIDTPEILGKCDLEKDLAQQARTFLASLINGQNVWLSQIHYGKYAGRLLAQIKTKNGLDPAEKLVEKGLARRYLGAKRLPWCP